MVTNQEQPECHDFLDEIIGEKLSAVVFVMDYYQFEFDGPKFNVFTPVEVVSPSGRAVTGDDQFRNLVCRQIAKVVRGVEVRSGEALVVSFEDASVLRFSLKASDYPGPEAVLFLGREWGVF